MSTHPIPLGELAAAVQNAVEQALSKHGAVSVDKLWVGFVAPEAIATSESAQKVASLLSKEGGIKAEPSVGQLGVIAAGGAQEHAVPQRIIGLIFNPKLPK
jgi:hypothetical protein